MSKGVVNSFKSAQHRGLKRKGDAFHERCNHRIPDASKTRLMRMLNERHGERLRIEPRSELCQ